MAMYRIIGYFALFEILGFWGFIIVSRYQEGMMIRFLPLLLAVVAVAFITFLKAKAFSYREIAYISVAASALFAAMHLLLGFTLYPGLVKGTAFLSMKTLTGSIVMLSIGTAGHFLLLSLARERKRPENPGSE